MNRLTELKSQVRRQVAALPASLATLACVLDRPLWQVQAALDSLARDGHVVLKRGVWRSRNPHGQPNARRRV